MFAAVVFSVSLNNSIPPLTVAVASGNVYIVSVSVHGTLITPCPAIFNCSPYVLLAVDVIPFAAVRLSVSLNNSIPPLAIAVASGNT